VHAKGLDVSSCVDYAFLGGTDIPGEKRLATTPRPKALTAEEAQYDTQPLYVQAAIPDLLDSRIHFEVKSKKPDSPLNGSCGTLDLSRYIKEKSWTDVAYTVNLSVNNTAKGTLSGVLSLMNVPTTSQLVGGKHTEEGSTGKLLCDWLAPPSKYRIKVSSSRCVVLGEGLPWFNQR
jgi:hypothetical protein